ncbi:MAG: hypothetical protein QM728_03570 [Gordonia sp. (in: high G+C Gram-positive bacteria)]|uniref:SecDF P1 head subdomain-containing protein n=1 Tax=Gordonia sp. (in: high G+C Gram-positive bacteria) TaxID=84139 RepID=UPI0039E4D23F
MKRAHIALLTLLLPVGLLAGCSKSSDDTGDNGARVEFGVESVQSTDGEFPPGSDRTKLVNDTVTALTKRLTAAGLKDPKVEAGKNGDSVTVSTASGNGGDITELASAGTLRIRPVLFSAPKYTGPGAEEGDVLDVELRQANPETPQAEMARRAQMLKCDDKDALVGRDDPASLLVTCSADGKTVYSLGPAVVDGTGIAKATAAQAGKKWAVNLDYKPEAQSALGAYTGANDGKQVAFLVDTRVVDAPKIAPGAQYNAVAPDGFTQAQAKNLATALGSGPLPVRLVKK